MFSSQLYSKLSTEEKSILDSYTERVNQCQSKLKSLASQGPEFHSFDEGASHPMRVLPTFILNEESRLDPPSQSLQTGPDLRYEPPERDTSTRLSVPSIQDLSDTPKPRAPRTLSKKSNSSSKRHSREPTPKKTGAETRPRSAHSRPLSSGRKKTKGTLNLKLVPNLEEEVENLLRIVYKHAKKNAELMVALDGGCKLYLQYARTMNNLTKRKGKRTG